jgi:hypothetical protein
LSAKIVRLQEVQAHFGRFSGNSESDSPVPASLQYGYKMIYHNHLQDRRTMARKNICLIRPFSGGSLPAPGCVNYKIN